MSNHGAALAEFRSAIDNGYRSILFEGIVRFEEFEMFSPLHDHAEFQQMIAEIKADNARMLERIRLGLGRMDPGYEGSCMARPSSPSLGQGDAPLEVKPGQKGAGSNGPAPAVS